MSKYVARVREVHMAGIHKVGHIENGQVVAGSPMPLPDRVEIEPDIDGAACMMYRYTKSGDFCGDTWHQDLASALDQAKFEYGLEGTDFLLVTDGGVKS
jgi:hypothetical protein